MRLKQKVAIVTGAGRHGGLGEAIARSFVQEGAHVLIADLAQPSGPLLDAADVGLWDEMQSVAGALREVAAASESQAKISAIACDVRSEEDVRACIAHAVEQFGKLDIVVNNAGVGYVMRPVTELTVDEWNLVQEVNLRGPFLFTKHGAAQMITQYEAGSRSGGRIINIASRGAKVPTREFAAYTSSKHGLLGLTRVAALELGAYGITSNAVCPNHVTTGLGARQNAHRSARLGVTLEALMELRRSQIPLARIGTPTDTARACVFLASSDADYITGEALNVSGGEEMR
jgi:meso-butanediol dehydrogenase/(S,S)-butanediol dehydrogenase/diacetyl reductase